MVSSLVASICVAAGHHFFYRGLPQVGSTGRLWQRRYNLQIAKVTDAVTSLFDKSLRMTSPIKSEFDNKSLFNLSLNLATIKSESWH